ncbi:MAG: hypothetical protein C9356_16705 [Oleiphilus sp.]|nr:MAG: hypothetical protein C9356_16705 [Oleiphilus sp.]
MMRALFFPLFSKVEHAEMTPILNIALRAVRQANEYIVQTIDKRDPASADASTDRKLITHLESTLFQVLLDHLKRGYPTHYVCEPGEVLTSEKEDSWHISGFDKTEAFTRRLPGCTFNLVHKHRGKLQSCIIVNVFNGDEYTATKGAGAAINNRRIRCTPARAIGDAITSTNAHQKLQQQPDNPACKDFLNALCTHSNGILVTSDPVFDLAMLAAGQTDLALLLDVEGRDLAAATLLCQEAGALTGTLDGGLLKMDTLNHVVAANPKLYKSVVQRFGGYHNKLP